MTIDKNVKDGLQSDIRFLNEVIKEIERIDKFTKVNKVIERIKNLKPSIDKKIVVFVGFMKTGEKLVENLEKEDIKSGFFYNKLEEAQRQKLIDKLWSKDEDKIDVLACTDAAYAGLNLQIADIIIHHDLSCNPMIIEQRVGRIHSIGEKREITSYSFLCKYSIDKRKHEILTKKLKEIPTHLGMNYSVILSEAAISSEIEKLMAQFELKEIDEENLKEGLKNHIKYRKEIFELPEELPSEEAEILHIGFTNELIEKLDEIVSKLIKSGSKILSFRIKPILEDHDFIILDYEKDGKISTPKEKALLSVIPENVFEWKEKYQFENLNPSYLGQFHALVRKTTDLIIKQKSAKFWKKKIINGSALVAFYLLMKLKIKNPTAKIDTEEEIFIPILYEIDKKEIQINTFKTYELACSCRKLEEELDEKSFEFLNEANETLNQNINNIKDKIRADIEKVKVETEELVLEKQRLEIQRKIEGMTNKLDSINKEINRKRYTELRYEKRDA